MDNNHTTVFEKVHTVFGKYIALKEFFKGQLTSFEYTVAVFLVFEYKNPNASLTALRNITKYVREIISDIEDTVIEEDDRW